MAAISRASTKELMTYAGHHDNHVAMRYQETINTRKRYLAARMGPLGGHGDADPAGPASASDQDQPRS